MSSPQNLKKKTISGFLWRLCERLSAQVVSFLVSVVLARLLLPEQYGLIALVMIFIGIADVFVISGFSNVLVQKLHVDAVDFSTVFYMSLGLACVVYGAIFAGAPYLAVWYDKAELVSLLRILALRLPLSCFNSIQQAWVSRHMQFRSFFYATFAATAVSGVVGIVLALRGLGVWALVGQNLSSLVISTLVLLYVVPWRPQLLYSWTRFRELFNYGWRFTATSMIGTIFDQLRGFVIGSRYTAADLAFVNRGEQIPNIVAGNVTTALSSVLFPAFSQLQEEPDRLRRALRQSMRMGSFILMPCMFILLAASHNIIVLLLTEKWLACVPFMQVVCLQQCVGFLGGINLQTITGIGRVDISLKLEFVKKPLYLAILLLTLSISPLAIVIGNAVYGVFAFVLNAFPNKRLLAYPIAQQLSDVAGPVALGAVMGLLVALLDFFSLPPLLGLCLQVVLGVAIYAGLAKVFLPELWQAFLQLLGESLKRVKEHF